MTTMYSKFAVPAPLGGNRGVLAAAQSLHAAGEAFVLAIVVGTQGSTYRKSGAMALVAQDGSTESVISGGCLESTLQDTALKVLADDQPQLLVFDTQSKDDVIFGSGSACRGLMQVLLVPVRPDRTNPLYSIIDEAHRRRASLKLAVSISELSIAQGIAWTDNEERMFGAVSATLRSLRDAQNGNHKLQHGTSTITAAVFGIKPVPSLLLIGAGPEVSPLMRIARSLGWFVTLVDHRAATVNACSLQADHKLVGRPHAALLELGTSNFDAALIMTHTAAADLEALQALAARNEPYVGLLGPPARRDELLGQLSVAESAALNARLHAPLGLRLGGDGPEPLALSIAAELQRFFTQA